MRRFIPQALLKSPWPRPSVKAPSISSAEPLEEEETPYYNSSRFYPAHIGEVLNDRYELVSKLGFGSHSTVWLARDLYRWRCLAEKFMAVKINAIGRLGGKRLSKNEVEVSRHIATANPDHEGWQYVRRLEDTFEIPGSIADHDCLVFQPLREPLWMIKQRFKGGMIPLDIVKIMAHMMLKSLDYLHTECRVVHADLKLDNAMGCFENPTLMGKMAEDELKNPLPQKQLPDRVIYMSRNNYGQPQREASGRWALPTIVDFGHAIMGDGPHYGAIQAEAYRAPEVVLNAGWSYSADIWSFGILLWDLLQPKTLFHEVDPGYEEVVHLRCMHALMGEPPKKLLDRGRRTPLFYDNQAKLTSASGFPSSITLEQRFEDEGDGSQKDLFLAFEERILKWLPEDRPSAKELLNDAWFADMKA